MPISEEERAVVDRVGEAMQAGAAGEEEMMSLFAADGVLIDPFNGPPQTSTGKDAIRARYREMVSVPRPPDFKLTTNKVWAEGGKVYSEWTCTASVMPGPMVGKDTYDIENGLIKRLEIAILQAPGMP